MTMMQIAITKREENIIEYLLYMFQVEDTIRAFNFDLQQIEKHLVIPNFESQELRAENLGWYSNLLLIMEKEQLRPGGHMQFLRNIINDLFSFHLSLISGENDQNYQHFYRQVTIIISELRQKSPGNLNDVELGLNALYGILLLRLTQREISEETRAAIHSISDWLGRLASLYRQSERGDLELQIL